MLIAAFLRTEDGQFDVGSLGLAVAMTFTGGYVLSNTIPKAIRNRRIYYSTAAFGNRGTDFLISQDKTPVLFWGFVTVYAIFCLALIVCGILLSFGIQRRWK